MTSIAPRAAGENLPAGELPAAPPRRSPRRLSFNPRQSGIYVAFALIVVLFTVLTDGPCCSRRTSRTSSCRTPTS